MLGQKVLAGLGWLTRRPRAQKRIIVFGTDLMLLVISVWFAWFLRMGEWNLSNKPIGYVFAGALVLMVPTFIAAGVYRAIFRYAGVGMMRTLFRALAVYLMGMSVVFTLISVGGVPRTIGFIQPMVFGMLILWSRTTVRHLIVHVLSQNSYVGEVRRAIIYGAGGGGQQLAHSLRGEPSVHVCGYVDDDRRLDGQKLDGDRVYWSEHIAAVIERHRVTDVFLALPSASRKRRRTIIASLSKHKLNVQTLPTLAEVVDGRISFSDIRPIQIEDLLGREPVRPNELLLGRTIVNKTVLVSGAGGSIGSELCRQILAVGAKRLLLLEMSEFALYSIERELADLAGDRVEVVPLLGSVCDHERVREIFAREAIDTVYHAAAYKHVPLVQANPIEAIRNNVIGTLELLRAAHANDVRDFILISTDKAVRPTNVMGATKRCAEQIVQSFAAKTPNGRYSMVRFGNVLGSSGSVVPLFRRQIEEGGPITLTHNEVTRYFMTIPEAANLVIQAGGMAKGGEVFVLDMGKPVKIRDLAHTMVQLSGLAVRDKNHPDGDIEIVEIGLRSGEKLFEELLIGERPSKTNHSRIMKAHESCLEWNELGAILDDLRVSRDPIEAVALLKRVVPEFENRRDDQKARAIS